MSTRLLHAAAARLAAAALGTLLVLAVPGPASAARVLFVSDDRSDLAIVDVLRADGHTVTSVESDFTSGTNPTFHGDLAGYDCIVWSASGGSTSTIHTDALAFTNLYDFASNGGSVLVTGWGAVGADDMRLLELLGATDGTPNTGVPRQIAMLDSDLTTGVVDIRGITPSSFGRYSWEALSGLSPDTTLIVASQNDPAAAQWAIRSVGTGHVAWLAGLEDAGPQWTPTDVGPGGVFNAALRNFVTASTGTASVPGAPRVGFSTPFSALEGAALAISARVTDPEGDTVSFSWDLDADGDYGEAADETEVMIPAGTTDGPGDFVVGIEASDGVHVTRRARIITITNVAPLIESRPPTVAGIGQHIRYRLEVVDPGATHDVPTFTLRTGPASAFLGPDGVFDWIPTEAEITAPGTMRAVIVDVDDGDGGLATQSWSMVVVADHAPSDPTLLYPPMGAAVLVEGLHFSVGNASDLDGDPITYLFELASNDTFDADLQTSGMQPGSPSGITEWAPDESSLHVGRWYWRVSASDGQVRTHPVGASFFLVPDPTALPDTGAPDAGPDAGATAPMPRGCSCAIASPGSAVGPFAAICALSVLVLVRRRRRR